MAHGLPARCARHPPQESRPPLPDPQADRATADQPRGANQGRHAKGHAGPGDITVTPRKESDGHRASSASAVVFWLVSGTARIRAAARPGSIVTQLVTQPEPDPPGRRSPGRG
jgi:hypothetical protein